VVAPGVGLLDLVVNPLAVRAFSRHQELAADRRAVEILGAMGYRDPEASMARALRALDRTSPDRRKVSRGCSARIRRWRSG
jgi:Zn-dependent protease with chaperone function